MKRIMALLLLAAMGLSLAACATPTQTPAVEPTTVIVDDGAQSDAGIDDTATDDTSADATVDAGSDENADAADDTAGDDDAAEDETTVCCIVTVTINPQFRLELNKSGRVVAFVPLNDDAKNATAGLNLVGKMGDEALEEILDQLYTFNSAFFGGDNPEIHVLVESDGKEGTYNQVIANMDQTFDDFAAKNQIPLAYKRQSQALGTRVISDTVDANGNRVLVELDPDGTEWKTVIDPQTNQVLELTRTDPDGTVTHSDSTAGIITVTTPDGTTTQSQGVIGKG